VVSGQLTHAFFTRHWPLLFVFHSNWHLGNLSPTFAERHFRHMLITKRMAISLISFFPLA
jgi:hypothetical protein